MFKVRLSEERSEWYMNNIPELCVYSMNASMMLLPVVIIIVAIVGMFTTDNRSIVTILCFIAFNQLGSAIWHFTDFHMNFAIFHEEITLQRIATLMVLRKKQELEANNPGRR